MKHTFSFLLVLVVTISMLTISCRKDEKPKNETINFPVTFQLKNIIQGDVRVYTRDGEITDPSRKASAIISTGVNDIAYNFGPQVNSSATISFLSDTLFRIGLYEYYSYTKRDSNYVFTMLDSAVGPFNYYASLVSPFLLYPEMKANNNGTYTYKTWLIANGGYTTLSILKLDVCLLKRDSVTGNIIQKYSTRNVSNRLNVEALKTLGSRDTVAVREFSCDYR